MKRKNLYGIIFSALLVMMVMTMFAGQAAASSSHPQIAYQTPTARPDGRIIYIVQPGDTCLRVSLLNNVSVDDLRLLNNLKQDCVLRVGQELLLGKPAVLPTVVPGKEVTPTPLLPTPTIAPGNGVVCVVLFQDLNGNAMREPGEAILPGGAVSVANRSGQVSLTGVTQLDEKGVCFEKVSEGDYTISMAVPTGYNATMATNLVLKLMAGDTSIVNFGAQPSAKAAAAATAAPAGPVEAPSNQSPLLGVLGALLVLGGGGLAFYIRLIRR